MKSVRTVGALLVVVWSGLAVAETQSLAPPPPKEYRVQLRYRIYAARNERLKQYFALLDFLKAVGFRKDPGEFSEPEDPTETRMTGVIDAAHARRLLLDPHVKSLLLLPAEYKLPAEGDVPVRIELVAGLPLDRQRQLFEQTRTRLIELGYRDRVGYDHRGFRRLVGTFPAADLDTLLKDLRGQPTGWLTPIVPIPALPAPLRNQSPVLVTEVLSEPAGVPPVRELPPAAAPPEKGQEHLLKISPDLRELAEKEDQPARLEVILNYTPRDEDGWRRALGDAVIEGRIGPLVTILASPKSAPALAESPIVSTVRLPRPAMPQARLPRGTKNGNLDALQASGLLRLHTLGHRGKGVRIAVVDGDFRGYSKFLGKGLPAGTHYVDLTAERNPNLEPDPLPGDAHAVGHGTECALAVALAAPRADLTLVRIDPASPHQLQAVARYIHGEDFRSESYAQRFDQLDAERNRLDALRVQLRIERKLILDNFATDQETTDKRKAYRERQAEFDAQEKTYQDRVRRLLQLQGEYRDLKNIQIVTSALVWNDGYPLGGGSPLSRYFDDRPFRAALWFQSAGNTRGQTWAGLFHDSDSNGVMEFAPPGTLLRPERWTPELNFLAWQPYGKKLDPDLPAKLKLRLSIQWREAHEPEYYPPAKTTADLYRAPLADLRLLIVRQRDPRGEKIAADSLEVIARSEGLPQRLENQPTYAVYEQTVELTVEPAGRYAVRVEGRLSPGTHPASVPALPAMLKSWELKPRLFVNVVDAAFRLQGRAVFLDYATDLGALGMPADARGLITVGAADPTGTPQPYSTRGPALNLELLPKPDVLSFDGLLLGSGDTNEAYGAAQAAAFASGLTASAFSAGTDRIYFLRALRERTGKPLQVP